MNRFIFALIIANLIGLVATDYVYRTEVRPVQEQQRLDEFVGKLMEQCRTSLSETRKIMLTRQLARIASKSFHSRDEMEAFVLLVCIESKFQSSVRSKAGAIGLSQLMPKYAEEFASQCGLGKLSAEDLLDSETNLTIGACQFHSLLRSFNGNVGLALAAYNAGEYSTTTKKAASLQDINPETANYVSKFTILKGLVSTH
jgi:hypothetical protein